MTEDKNSLDRNMNNAINCAPDSAKTQRRKTMNCLRQPAKLWSVLVLLVAAMSSTACDDDENNPTCNPVCDAAQCMGCVDGVCMSSCMGDEVCDNGTCVAEQVCDPACNSNACMKCVEGSCENTCTAGQTCDGEGTCVDDNICEPTCVADDCMACVSGSCESTCSASQTCDGTGTCVDDNTCEPACATDDCMACVNDSCEYTCTAGQTCDGAGTCVDVCDPTCNVDNCEACVNGTCIVACSTTSCMVCDGTGSCVTRCGIGEVCDGSSACRPGWTCDPTCDEDACQACIEGDCFTGCGVDEICDGASNCIPAPVCDPACDADACESCIDDSCVDTCDPAGCLSCDGSGSCVRTCDENELCDNGTCIECTVDEDCPGVFNFCLLNTCQIDCPSDSYEENDSSDSAAAVFFDQTETDLTICEGEEDWFAFTLQEGHGYYFRVDFENATGDVDIRLYAASNMNNSVGLSNGWYWDFEFIEYVVPEGQGGEYFLEVYIFASQESQQYNLNVVDAGVPSCLIDSDCSSSQVCTAFTCSNGCRSQVDCNSHEICVDFQCVTGCNNNWDCYSGQYCHDLQCMPVPTGETCGDPIVVSGLPFRDSGVDASIWRADIGYEGSSCTGDGTWGPDSIYKVFVPAGNGLKATMTPTSDLALYVTSDCSVSTMPDATCLGGSDAQGMGGIEEVFVPAHAEHRLVYVVVDSPSVFLNSGIYDLSIDLQ